METPAREEGGRDLRSRNFQKFFMFAGSSPWPVVEHTKTTAGSRIRPAWERGGVGWLYMYVHP